jgi:hypothetical protein
MEKEITKQANSIARLLEAELNKQKPFSKTVRVRAIVKSNAIDFVYSYPVYGKFLDLGTERYRVDEAQRGAFSRSPGKGIGGIKPRFWMTINESTKVRIAMMLETFMVNLINNELKKAFKTGIK